MGASIESRNRIRGAGATHYFGHAPQAGVLLFEKEDTHNLYHEKMIGSSRRMAKVIYNKKKGLKPSFSP